jgi:hypothetical protein
VDVEAIADLVRRINATDSRKGVVYVAGGGTEVFPMLLAQGGGSNTLLAGRILYAPDDFRDAIGSDPERFVDARAARGLAMAAFRHALKVRGDLAPESVFGIGATSKLSTGEGEREGRSHEIHAALHMPLQTIAWSATLPGGCDRAWEEHVNALMLLNFIAFGKIVYGDYQIDYDGCGRTWNHADFQYASGEGPIADLFTGRRAWVSFDGPPSHYPPPQDEYWWETENHEPPRLLLPGSFRPLHEGHVAMADAASRLSGLPCAYELSIFHPEKLPLDYFAIRSRLKGFEPMKQCRLYLTNAPTYLDKARLFPGCTFVVGHDTAKRIVDPRFYGGPAGRDSVLDELERLGARFLVFGRVDASGEFRDFSAEEFEHPVAGFLERVATPVPGDVFRLDISSTEVRRRSGEEFP